MYKDRTKTDWSFSDNAHSTALEIIYKKFANIVSVEKANKSDDLNNGIDYWVSYKKEKEIITESVQERFRLLGKFTENSQEFTLRYKRENSQRENEKQSEFFKIKADYLLYGITTNQATNENVIGFKRYVFIDLNLLLKEINKDNINIDENLDNKKNNPYISNDKVYAIVKNNYEDKSGNSSLLIFDVRDVIGLNPDIVVYQYGYELNNQKIITQTNTRKMKY